MHGLAEWVEGFLDESSKRSYEDISEDCLRMKKLPATARSKMTSEINPHNTHLPKLHGREPSHVSKKSNSLTISQLLPGPQRNTTGKGHHASLSSQMQVLELFREKTKTFTELRAESGLPHSALKHFVRTGMLAEAWGREGVGLSLKLTRKGAKQLREFKEANLDNGRYSRKSLISLKTRVGP